MTTTPGPIVDAARADEADALVDMLRQRNVVLNVEVRVRDARIVELEQELAQLRNAPAEEARP